MADNSSSSSSQHATAFMTGAHAPRMSYAASLRQRPQAGRSVSTGDTTPLQQPVTRRNSTFSDTISEARQSLRDSTDDLLFPRPKDPENLDELVQEESHWHSIPLALALLPAIGGLFFQNGSAVLTDATLLFLAAVFLNWSVRLPWQWYRSAQVIRRIKTSTFADIDSEKPKDDVGEDEPHRVKDRSKELAKEQAVRELHVHELAALVACFVFPVIGAWLLHTVRGALSRPSEGLVSNYNLTIFLLAAEIRPFAHLLRMVHARTLHLQRVIEGPSETAVDVDKLGDVVKRLEELEAHVADRVAAEGSKSTSPGDNGQSSSPSDALLQIAREVRREVQPELDALKRAVRRYERRTTVMAHQTDTRLQQLEDQVRDAIALAAAAQRTAEGANRPRAALILLDWICAMIVVPTQTAMSVAVLPGRIAGRCLERVGGLLFLKRRAAAKD
ncbi:hypothetical protein VTN49DRAFT_4990 [Thermomyces lanuginosus]|uniref:uncharacterized protein n=1 Tax=Thermomyces lanuginosus TaxID=5541 RepID=UPI00374443CF